MTPQEFKEARKALGLKQREMADILNVSQRTVRSWEQDNGIGQRPVNATTARVVEWLLNGFRPPQWPKD